MRRPHLSLTRRILGFLPCRSWIRPERIGPHDLWLAAAALAHGLTLATGNLREFDRVPGLDVEAWGG